MAAIMHRIISRKAEQKNKRRLLRKAPFEFSSAAGMPVGSNHSE
jgi:hypothetical protein